MHKQWVQVAKNPPKLSEEFVKLIDHTSANNSLTNFEYDVNEMTEKGSYVNLLILTWKNS